MRSGVAVALPLTAMSSQFVIGSFEARFFFAQLLTHDGQSTNSRQALNQILPHRPHGSLRAIRHANLPKNMLDVLLHRFVADA